MRLPCHREGLGGRYPAAGGACSLSAAVQRNEHGSSTAVGDSYVCLGTDCNARIDFQSEMSWLEYGQCLRFRCRGVLSELSPVPATISEDEEASARSVSWQLF